MAKNEPRHELKPKLRGLLMDLNFNHKGIIRQIRGEYGADAVLFVQEILFSLAAEPGGKMKLASLERIGAENALKPDDIASIINILLSYSSPWLFKDSDNYLYSDRILFEQIRYLKRCKVNRANGKRIGKQIAPESPSDSIDIDINTDTDLNNKNIESASVTEWVNYRKSIGKKLSKVTIERLIKKQAQDPELFSRSVEHSIESGYQGLFPPSGSASSQPRKAQNVINEERSLATMNKMLSEIK